MYNQLIHVRMHTHVHIYTHTHTHARMCSRSWCQKAHFKNIRNTVHTINKRTCTCNMVRTVLGTRACTHRFLEQWRAAGHRAHGGLRHWRRYPGGHHRLLAQLVVVVLSSAACVVERVMLAYGKGSTHVMMPKGVADAKA
eukprot:scaffold6798_cov24-Tisochrysis_lutea.AAC.1